MWPEGLPSASESPPHSSGATEAEPEDLKKEGGTLRDTERQRMSLSNHTKTAELQYNT